MSSKPTVTKIIIIVDTMVAGGKERRLLELLKGLENNETISVCLVILSNLVEYEEVHHLAIQTVFLPRRGKKDFTIFYKLYRVIKKFNPDIIQSWSSVASVFLLPTVLSSKAQFINAIIADAPWAVKPFSSRWWHLKLSFPLSDAIISNSEAGIKAYNAPSQKSYCIPNGIDLARFDHLPDASEVRRRFGITTTYVVGMVASFRGAKDYSTYLKAAQYVLEHRYDVTFMAIGDGKDLAGLSKMYENEEKIIFTGRIADIEAVVNIFNVGVLITDHRMHGEGIPNSVMEYMALSKPVIATDAGGTTELVLDQITGLICQQRDPHDLKEKIVYLLDHSPIALAMGKAGRERIEASFTLDTMTQAYLQLYN
ncbi:glycosyltransferase [Tunicatimonas pelagia]|uniref:glycosyltransferase n=1 Tax=Tunicatimonas pelagia TaxID=931531 RepID=UPI002666E628|nr:glycosyltransferase [Tunicatimonas pelagia]WKN41973.1 glycosyltransferase [Tunicatimonas pelagia]